MHQARFALALSLGALIIAPACTGGAVDTNAQSLAQGGDAAGPEDAPDARRDRRRRGDRDRERERPPEAPPEEPEPWDEEPGDEPDTACDDAIAALDRCQARLERTCGADIQALDRCHEGALAGCDALFESFESCLADARDPRRCEPFADAAHQCVEQAHLQCAEFEARAAVCFEQCAQAEAEAHAICHPGPEPEGGLCEHLFSALELCHQEGRGPGCLPIELAILGLCEDDPCDHPPEPEPPHDDERDGPPEPPEGGPEAPEGFPGF